MPRMLRRHIFTLLFKKRLMPSGIIRLYLIYCTSGGQEHDAKFNYIHAAILASQILTLSDLFISRSQVQRGVYQALRVISSMSADTWMLNFVADCPVPDSRR